MTERRNTPHFRLEKSESHLDLGRTMRGHQLNKMLASSSGKIDVSLNASSQQAVSRSAKQTKTGEAAEKRSRQTAI